MFYICTRFRKGGGAGRGNGKKGLECLREREKSITFASLPAGKVGGKKEERKRKEASLPRRGREGK